MNPKPYVVYPMSDGRHVQQILYGFDLLARRGGVAVRYAFDGPARFGIEVPFETHLAGHVVMVETPEDRLLCFETHDSGFVEEKAYHLADAYFKRSYHDAEHASRRKMRPLGLNLLTQPFVPGLARIRRALAFRGAAGAARVVMAGLRHRVDNARLIMAPACSASPTIAFFTRTYDPASSASRSEEKARQWRELSEFRAACVRALRDRFGPAFHGGLHDDAYARAHYPDLVVPRAQTGKSAYLKIVRQADICIATEGLERSTGWKFAEYLAMGRAIVSEPQAFNPGGGIRAGSHYLEFASVDQCVAAVQQLMDNHTQRAAMMRRNFLAYLESVEPEALVRSALLRALEV